MDPFSRLLVVMLESLRETAQALQEKLRQLQEKVRQQTDRRQAEEAELHQRASKLSRVRRIGQQEDRAHRQSGSGLMGRPRPLLVAGGIFLVGVLGFLGAVGFLGARHFVFGRPFSLTPQALMKPLAVVPPFELVAQAPASVPSGNCEIQFLAPIAGQAVSTGGALDIEWNTVPEAKSYLLVVQPPSGTGSPWITDTAYTSTRIYMDYFPAGGEYQLTVTAQGSLRDALCVANTTFVKEPFALASPGDVQTSGACEVHFTAPTVGQAIPLTGPLDVEWNLVPEATSYILVLDFPPGIGGPWTTETAYTSRRLYMDYFPAGGDYRLTVIAQGVARDALCSAHLTFAKDEFVRPESGYASPDAYCKVDLVAPIVGQEIPTDGPLDVEWKAVPQASSYVVALYPPSGTGEPWMTHTQYTSARLYMEYFPTGGEYELTVGAQGPIGNPICGTHFTLVKRAYALALPGDVKTAGTCDLDILAPTAGQEITLDGPLEIEWYPIAEAAYYVLVLESPPGTGSPWTIETPYTSRRIYMDNFPAGGDYRLTVTAYGAARDPLCLEQFAFFKPPLVLAGSDTTTIGVPPAGAPNWPSAGDAQDGYIPTPTWDPADDTVDYGGCPGCEATPPGPIVK